MPQKQCPGRMSFSQNTSEGEFDDVILTGNLIQKKPWDICKKLVIHAPNEKVHFCLVSVSDKEAVTPGPAVISVLTGRNIKPSFK